MLMLHRVMPDRPMAFGRPSCYRLRGTALTPEEFDRLLEAGPFRSLDEVVEALSRGEPPPPGLVLTFDDGYREWVEYVALRLSEHRASATFFICPAFLQEASEAHPVDVFYWLLDHARRSRFELRLPDGTVAGGSLETDEGKTALITGSLKQFVVGGARGKVREVLARLAEVLLIEVPGALPRMLYPSERELETLRMSGHRLGGHGMRHRHLTKMSEEEVSTELSASVAWVARLSGGRAVPFAYPDGAFDLAVARRVERVGASCALTCVPGPLTRESGLFQLPREFVTPGHPLVVAG
ncbi:polysaccharide deacetylase family protein [Archangium violaceum]|uniref:polysaccharide deacetylase family protein n=1 Tax=Archangium violaceum TaxID=83451 RepID=UPI001F1F3A20|nr:polysaccharide deacetylase family protein [Archangium violaceum]